ncbi:MAG: AEC family transporter, partial [Agathobacter sp.]
LSKISSPLALIILGGQFDFAAVKELRKQIAIGTLARVVIVPTIAIGLAITLSTFTSLIDFSAEVYPAFIALFGTPVAVSSAIMAQEMDNDGTLAGQLVVWTSIASIFTIFFFVVACAILIPGFTY